MHTSCIKCIDCNESYLTPSSFHHQEGFVEILSQNYNYYQILPFIPPLANTVVASLNGILFV